MNPYYASDPRAWAFFAIATVLTLAILIPYVTIQLNTLTVGYRLQGQLRWREFFVPVLCLLAGQEQRKLVRQILENRQQSRLL